MAMCIFHQVVDGPLQLREVAHDMRAWLHRSLSADTSVSELR